MTDRLGEALDLLSTEDGLLNEIDRHNAEVYVAAVAVVLAAARSWHTLRPLVRQFAFDIVMTELGMDEQDMDDQADTTEKVDAWMEHWQRMVDALSDTAEPEET